MANQEQRRVVELIRGEGGIQDIQMIIFRYFLRVKKSVDKEGIELEELDQELEKFYEYVVVQKEKIREIREEVNRGREIREEVSRGREIRLLQIGNQRSNKILKSPYQVDWGQIQMKRGYEIRYSVGVDYCDIQLDFGIENLIKAIKTNSVFFDSQEPKKKEGVKVCDTPFAENPYVMYYFGEQQGEEGQKEYITLKQYKQDDTYELACQIGLVSTITEYLLEKFKERCQGEVLFKVQRQTVYVHDVEEKEDFKRDKKKIYSVEKQVNHVGQKRDWFNNFKGEVNWGVESQYQEMAQAFSHYTYEVTERSLLINNLQGFLDKTDKKYLLKYPSIQSRYNQKRFGKHNTDMYSFIHKHRCNKICKQVGISKE